jgi:hypothetical protein
MGMLCYANKQTLKKLVWNCAMRGLGKLRIFLSDDYAG